MRLRCYPRIHRSPPATARSGLLQTFDDLPYGTTVDFSDAGFLPYVASAAYEWPHRVVSWKPADASGASWLEVRFTDDEQRGWRVLFAPDVGSFTLPVPPAPFEDRTFTTSEAPATAEFDALALRDGGTVADELDFTRLDGPLALDHLGQVSAWNSLALPVQGD